MTKPFHTDALLSRSQTRTTLNCGHRPFNVVFVFQTLRLSLRVQMLHLAICVGLGCVLSHHRESSAADLTSLPLDARPYRVRLLLACDVPQWSDAVTNDLLDETRRAAHRCIGEMWQLEIDHARWLQPAGTSALDRLTPDQLLTQTQTNADSAPPVDVWFVVAIQATRPGYRIDARAWQPELQQESISSSATVIDHRELPVSLLKLCRRVFRPVGLVESVDGKSAQMRLQAGSLTPPDDAFALAHPDDIYLPMIAVYDRDQRISRLQAIPWTLMTVTGVDGASASCDIASGLRVPLPTKPRPRVETLAIAVPVQHRSTRMELATQTKPSLPLVAHRIEVRSAPTIPKPDDDAAREEHLLKELLTDRRGLVEVPTITGRPLVWIFAYSGQHLLARVPFVPGSVSRVRLEVPDDSARLTAEADVQMLQGELIDAVAARNTLVANIRSDAKLGKWDAVDSRLNDLSKLPDQKTFLNRLTAIRIPMVSAAQARKDRAAEVRINRLCDEMSELIGHYLSEDKLRLLREEIAELKKSAADSDLQPPEKK